MLCDACRSEKTLNACKAGFKQYPAQVHHTCSLPYSDDKERLEHNADQAHIPHKSGNPMHLHKPSYIWSRSPCLASSSCICSQTFGQDISFLAKDSTTSFDCMQQRSGQVSDWGTRGAKKRQAKEEWRLKTGEVATVADACFPQKQPGRQSGGSPQC